MSDDFEFFCSFNLKGKSVIVGIDEAGRGPVVGPMVFGCYIHLVEDGDMCNLSFNDSKRLSKERREYLFSEIKKKSDFCYVKLSARYLNSAMKMSNLNEISYNVHNYMLRRVCAAYNVEKIYLDIVGPEKTHKARILGGCVGIIDGECLHCGTSKCVSMQKSLTSSKFVFKKTAKSKAPIKPIKLDHLIIESKADHKYKVVGGASIIAKIVRDSEVSTICTNITGYAPDEETHKYMKKINHPVLGLPSTVRYQWKTTDRYIPKRKENNKLQKEFSTLHYTDE